MELKEIYGESLDKDKLIEVPPLALAFVGDGVHTMFVRNNVVKKNIQKVGDYHLLCAHFCKALTQSKVLDSITNELTEQENDIVRRARNVKSHNIAKNSDISTYKKATGFEALIGYLYLSGNFDRMKYILEKSMEEICI